MNCYTRTHCPICFEVFKNDEEIVVLDCNDNDWIHIQCLLNNVKDQDADHQCFICSWNYHKILYEFEALAESVYDDYPESIQAAGSEKAAIVVIDDISDELEQSCVY